MVDSNKLEYKVFDIHMSHKIGKGTVEHIDVKLEFSVGDNIGVYNIAGSSKGLLIGNTLYEFEYFWFTDRITEQTNTLKYIIGALKEHNKSVEDILSVVEGMYYKLFSKDKKHYRLKYLEDGGYLFYLGGYGEIIELGSDGSFVTRYRVRKAFSMGVNILKDRGEMEIHTIGEYLGDFSWCDTNVYLNVLGFCALYDVRRGGCKVLEFTGINRCRLVDIDYVDYLSSNLKVSELTNLYFRPMDILGNKTNYKVYYKGNLVTLYKGGTKFVKNLVKNRKRFIKWYNNCIDNGWDYNIINSLLNYNGYTLSVVVGGNDLRVAKWQYNNEPIIEYYTVGIDEKGKLK